MFSLTDSESESDASSIASEISDELPVAKIKTTEKAGKTFVLFLNMVTDIQF